MFNRGENLGLIVFFLVVFLQERRDFLEEVSAGRIQNYLDMPDWVWDDEAIATKLVRRDPYTVGAETLLQPEDNSKPPR